MDIKSKNRGGSDARIALSASWGIVLVVVLQGTVSMLSQVTDDLTAWTRLAGVLSGVACAIVFVIVQRRAMQYRAVSPWMVLLAFVVAVVGLFAGAWVVAALAFGIFGLALMGWRFFLVGISFTVVLVAFMFNQGVHPLNMTYIGAVVLIIGLMLYVFTRLALTVGELARARETVERLRVDEERHRISRDLHDILGRTLIAVSLRTQTAISFLASDPVRCGVQLEEVARMISEGQTQLRGLTRGETVVSFGDELVSAKNLFDRLGIRCTIEVAANTTDDVVDGFGARVLRECVTNLLKHSRPTLVEVSLRQESAAHVLVIVNDGAIDDEGHGGSGLLNLAKRAEALGATLEAGYVNSQRFRVIARMLRASGDQHPVEVEPNPLGVGR